jgi:photosystem II stability/assembly factor-like uncharacterized protein
LVALVSVHWPATPSQPPRNKAQRWFESFRAFPESTFDSTFVRRLALGASKRTRPAAGGEWTFIGPKNLIHENIYGSPVSSGRVNALVVSSGNVIFAGADRGGVWKSGDGGITWRPLTDHLPYPSITALAISPEGAVFAGTGHGVVLRSADQGDSWDALALPDGAVRVTSFVFSDSGSLMAGIEGQGVFASTDRGGTWTRKLFVPNTVPMLGTVAGSLYATASSWDSATTHQGLYRSHDGGESWIRVALPFSTTTGPRTLRVDGGSGQLYLLSSSLTRLEGLYVSHDQGVTWDMLRPRFPEYTCATGNGPCPSMDSITVHPRNPNTVYIGRVWLYRSTDGGNNFEDINKSPSGVVPHVDHRAIAFSPDGSRIYDGNDGGVWTAPDDGFASGPLDWKSLSADLAITQFYPGMSLHPSDSNQVLAGTQDNSFVLWRDGVWRCGYTGDFMWTQIDPRDPRTAFAVLYPGREMVVRTRNDWSDFKFVASGMDTEKAPWISPLEMDPTNPDRLYFGTVRVFRTENQGDRWHVISPELGPISALSAAHGEPNRVYAASAGKIYAYRGGTQWDIVSTSTLPGRNIARIYASGSEVYVAYSGLRSTDKKGHVYYSPDAGATWQDRTGKLPDAPVNDLIPDPDRPGTLYAATDVGVHQSHNAGWDWEPLGTGLPLTTVSSIRIHRESRILRAATYGRGIWDLVLR